MHLAPDPDLLREAGALAGLTLNMDAVTPIAGGDISGAFRCGDQTGRSWFMKVNRAAFIDAFEAEAEGLREIGRAQQLRVPGVAASGTTADRSWLLLEWLDLVPGTPSALTTLGANLAGMHRTTASRHGWKRDNFIGSTAQSNRQSDDWAQFYTQQRLNPQLELARDNGASAALIDKGEHLLADLPAKLGSHKPVPSLLHGDLWGGNWGQLADGEPVIFDPAVYYGDRETDLAMTRLFGGFAPEFYDAYKAAWPLDAGHEYRCSLYQLYHVLNHFNLFGEAYAAQAIRLMDTLLERKP